MKKELTKEQKQKKILKKQLNEKRAFVAGQAVLGLAIALFATMFAVGLTSVFKFDNANKEDESVKKEERVYNDATFALGLTGATLTAVGGAMAAYGRDCAREPRESERAYLKRRGEELDDKCIPLIDLIGHGKQ